MATVLETPRLLLRPFDLPDAETAYTWLGDSVVMKYMPNGPDRSVEQTRERIAGYQEHQRTHGVSKWLVVDRQTGAAIGDAGLFAVKSEDREWIDLGYRLAQAYWGLGLATEAASAWIRTAFDQLGLRKLGAIVHPENRASIRILDKLGFQTQESGVFLGMPVIHFTLETSGVQVRSKG